MVIVKCHYDFYFSYYVNFKNSRNFKYQLKATVFIYKVLLFQQLNNKEA